MFVAMLTSSAILLSCGNSESERQRYSKAEKIKLAHEDSLALKVAVMPTLDCLPLFVAKDRGMFDTLGVDVRLRNYNAQMDCDTAVANGRVQGSVTDLVRAERLIANGTPLRFISSTKAYWLMIGNSKQRVNKIADLGDKMVAITRYSATNMLADRFINQTKTQGTVFRIQINDVLIRLKMLVNNEIDAVLLTEPQASEAVRMGNKVLADSRKDDLQLGVIAFRKKDIAGDYRSRQLQLFIRGYNMACDSINKYGVSHYSNIIEKHLVISQKTIMMIPHTVFNHAESPRQKDIDAAKKWLR